MCLLKIGFDDQKTDIAVMTAIARCLVSKFFWSQKEMFVKFMTWIDPQAKKCAVILTLHSSKSFLHKDIQGISIYEEIFYISLDILGHA